MELTVNYLRGTKPGSGIFYTLATRMIGSYFTEDIPLTLWVPAMVGITVILLQVIGRFVFDRLRWHRPTPLAEVKAVPLSKTLPPRRIVRDIHRRPRQQ